MKRAKPDVQREFAGQVAVVASAACRLPATAAGG